MVQGGLHVTADPLAIESGRHLYAQQEAVALIVYRQGQRVVGPFAYAEHLGIRPTLATAGFACRAVAVVE